MFGLTRVAPRRPPNHGTLKDPPPGTCSRHGGPVNLGQRIRLRRDEFLASQEPTLRWLRLAAAEHGFLPLYTGWMATVGISTDGTFVRWEQEEDPPRVETLDNRYQQRFALSRGALTYPELAALIPPRPAEAEDCPGCGGTGQPLGHPTIICECGGVGWVVPGEDRGSTLG